MCEEKNTDFYLGKNDATAWFQKAFDISKNGSQHNKLEVNISVGSLVGVREKDTVSCLVGLFLSEGLSAETQFSSADRACVRTQPAQRTSVQMLQRRNHPALHVNG